MFADNSIEVSRGADIPRPQSVEFAATTVNSLSTAPRYEFGRAVLSAAAMTLSFDTFSNEFAITQGAERNRAAPPECEPVSHHASAETVLEKVLRDRANLFVVQMTHSKTAENEARLLLLTAQLRELDPRVTGAELDALTRAVDNLTAAKSTFQEFESEFGF